MPGRNGNLIELGLGGLSVDAAVDVASLLGGVTGAESSEPHWVNLTATLNVIVGANLEVDDETQTLVIQPDPERFPSGMKALADYVHSLGLKIGIYSDAGWKTCAGKPGSRGYEFQDALTYAEWGIDYLKYDWCNTEELSAEGAYLTMRDALYAAGRPIVFSICEWGDNEPWEWAAELGHLWRTTGDIIDCFDCEIGHGSWSSWGILRILDKQEGLRQYAGPGHWNDPDMMEVGNSMSVNEDRAHFSMWAMCFDSK